MLRNPTSTPIAGTAASAADAVGYTAAQLGVGHLVAAAPALREFDLECEQIAQLDGLFLTGGGDVHPRYFNQLVDGADPDEIHDERDNW